MPAAKDAWSCSRSMLIAIDRAMQQRGLTNTALAAALKPLPCNEATIRHLRSGKRVRQRYIERVCAVLELETLFNGERRKLLAASDEFGGYRLATLPNYEGRFLHVRRSFSAPGDIVVSVCDIRWDPYARALAFVHHLSRRDEERPHAFRHEGHVHINPTDGSVTLLAADRGAVRAAMLTPLTGKGEPGDTMHGVLLTRRRIDYGTRPGVSALVLQKDADEIADTKVPASRRLRADTDDHAAWDAHLAQVEASLVKFATLADRPRR